MKPVKQTILGNGRNGTPYGNSFQACIASLLELSIDEIPAYDQDLPLSEFWPEFFDRFEEWLHDRGLYWWETYMLNEEAESILLDRIGWHVKTGPSPNFKGTDHSVIAYGREIRHDPSPTDAHLAGATFDEYRYGTLIPLDPATVGSQS